MTGSDHLSPAQFGFKPASYDEWDEALGRGFGTSGTRGRINPQMDLHTAQDYIDKDSVDSYAAQKRIRGDHDVEIYHLGGKAYVGDGHHRLAAARQKGQKSMTVTHFGDRS